MDAIVQFPGQTEEPGEELALIDRYWRAANYLSVGQIYLLDNALLRDPLDLAHLKPRFLGHWGTAPGLNFIYAHLNRIIRARGTDVLFVCGPGHGGAALLANSWLEGSYTDFYPEVTQDADGMRRLFRQFSFPGGVPSHAGPETPGSIHEGGELGYSLMHAQGAALDNPDLVVACVIGDGEAETAPLAASWHGNKLLSPVTDGAVLPILHLNGYKISAPTILGRMNDGTLEHLFRGFGYDPIFVDGSTPMSMHRQMAAALDRAFDRITHIQQGHRHREAYGLACWPMIVLRTPKGWTGPREVNGRKVEGFWRSHQVPVTDPRGDPAQLRVLEDWLRSYRPSELFDVEGRPLPELRAAAPAGDRRLGSTPTALGGRRRTALRRPQWRHHAIAVTDPGLKMASATETLGCYLADLMRLKVCRAVTNPATGAPA